MTRIADRIEKAPDVCGGDACIRKTRVPVWELVEDRQLGLSDAQILQRLPALMATDLEAAWDYYRQNPLEIDQALWENRAAMVESDGGDVPVAMLWEGRRLGLSDERIREAFEPPLAQSVLDRIWAGVEPPTPVNGETRESRTGK
jgi:uncharacterized protein (DUF433 family)